MDGSLTDDRLLFKDPGLLPTPLGVEVRHGWQLCPSDVLCSFNHSLSSLMVEGGATAIPSGMGGTSIPWLQRPITTA